MLICQRARKGNPHRLNRPQQQNLLIATKVLIVKTECAPIRTNLEKMKWQEILICARLRVFAPVCGFFAPVLRVKLPGVFSVLKLFGAHQIYNLVEIVGPNGIRGSLISYIPSPPFTIWFGAGNHMAIIYRSCSAPLACWEGPWNFKASSIFSNSASHEGGTFKVFKVLRYQYNSGNWASAHLSPNSISENSSRSVLLRSSTFFCRRVGWGRQCRSASTKLCPKPGGYTLGNQEKEETHISHIVFWPVEKHDLYLWDHRYRSSRQISTTPAWLTHKSFTDLYTCGLVDPYCWEGIWELPLNLKWEKTSRKIPRSCCDLWNLDFDLVPMIDPCKYKKGTCKNRDIQDHKSLGNTYIYIYIHRTKWCRQWNFQFCR